METAATRIENAKLSETLSRMQIVTAEKEARFEEDLQHVMELNQTIEREKDLYKDRYERILKVLKGLNLDDRVGSMDDMIMKDR